MTGEPAARLIAQLRREGISDEAVLDAVARTPRDAFVDEPFVSSAWQDIALPIACGQTISQPYVVAAMTQALDVGPKMRVLEIGTGSGYQAAVLARLARMVYTVERHAPLLAAAERRFWRLGLDNIVTRHGDGYQGWPEQAPFDRIVATAAMPEVPPNLIEQLKKPGGVLVAPVGKESFSQDLVRIIRGEGGDRTERLMAVMFVPMLPGLPRDAKKPDGTERKG